MCKIAVIAQHVCTAGSTLRPNAAWWRARKLHERRGAARAARRGGQVRAAAAPPPPLPACSLAAAV